MDTYLGAIKKVTVGTKAYTEATSIYFQNDNYRTKIADSTYGGYKDALDLAVNGIDAEKGTLITVEAKGYKTMTYTLKGDSATTDPTPNPGEDTKLDAPAYTIAEKTEYGATGSYPYYKVTFTGGNTREYVKNITSVMVQGTEYSLVSGTEVGEKSTSYVKETGFEDDLKLGTGSFVANGKTTVTIKATGYKDLVINYGTDATPTEPTTKPAPTGKIEHKEADNYYQVSFNGNDVSDYLNAITSVKVGNTDYTATEDSTPTGKQYSLGIILPSLKLGAEGFTGSGNITVTITATGYKENVVTYTMPNSGNSGGGTTAPGTPETPDNGGITVKECKLKQDWNGKFYEMRFNGFDNENDLASFVDSITEVQVGNDKKFTKATFSFSFSETEFGTVTENYSVGIKFYESSLADVEDGTTITIKGKVNGKDVTITYSLVKE